MGLKIYQKKYDKYSYRRRISYGTAIIDQEMIHMSKNATVSIFENVTFIKKNTELLRMLDHDVSQRSTRMVDFQGHTLLVCIRSFSGSAFRNCCPDYVSSHNDNPPIHIDYV